MDQAQPNHDTSEASTHLQAGSVLRTERRPHLLVADDTAANRMVVSRMLEKLGCTYELVSDGEEALGSLRQHHFDAVLMDCQMPGLDGFETTQKLRDGEAGEEARHLPVIAFTAYGSPEDRERSVAAGMDGFLNKPICFDALLKALQACSLLDDPRVVLMDGLPLLEEGVVERASRPPFNREDGSEAPFAESQWVVLSQLKVQNGHSALEETLRLFCEVVPPQLEQLQVCLNEGNRDLAARLAHAIGSSSASVGALQLRRAALRLESHLARSENDFLVSAHVDAVRAAFAQCLAHIQRKGVLVS